MDKVKRDLMEYEKFVLDELIENGYPKDSIILEWKLDVRRYVDLVVIDIDTGIPLMMIEIKTCSNRTQKAVKQLAFNRLKDYYEKSKIPIKPVAAILNRDERSFCFIDLSDAIKENDFTLIDDNYKLPPYELLIVGARRKYLNQQKEEHKQKISTLKKLCWGIIPAICLLLIWLDFREVYIFTNLRLIVIGACVAALLVPCLKEIKIGEITLKIQEEKLEELTLKKDDNLKLSKKPK